MKPGFRAALLWAAPSDQAAPTRSLMAFSCMVIRQHMSDRTAAMLTSADIWPTKS